MNMEAKTELISVAQFEGTGSLEELRDALRDLVHRVRVKRADDRRGADFDLVMAVGTVQDWLEHGTRPEDFTRHALTLKMYLEEPL